MRGLQLAFVLVVVGCNGPTLVESADVPVVDVALDFNPADRVASDTGADAGGCPPGALCLDAAVDVPLLVTDAPCVVGSSFQCNSQCGSGVGSQVCLPPGVLAPCECGPSDGGLPGADTGVDAGCVAGPGQTCCGGVATNPQTDYENCGGCGNRCCAGEVCSAGRCSLDCVAGSSVCSLSTTADAGCVGGGFCVDEQTDPSNCGSCGHVCATGQFCSEGMCLSVVVDAGHSDAAPTDASTTPE